MVKEKLLHLSEQGTVATSVLRSRFICGGAARFASQFGRGKAAVKDTSVWGVSGGGRMLFEDRTIRAQLERIIARMSDCDTWRDDLLQEGLIHLWRMEEQRPNQKLSWYLQGCLFHLRRFIAIGRSVDSWKRRQRVIPLPIDEQGDWEFLPPDYVDGEFISEIGAQEAIEYLCQWLTASEKEVLACLAEGLAPHEISQKLRISCKTILRYRRRIARLTLRLGLKD